jgi:hypothetical protein
LALGFSRWPSAGRRCGAGAAGRSGRPAQETKYLHRKIATENIQLEQRVKQRTAELEGADAILRKPGSLTPDEWDVMKTHTSVVWQAFLAVRER